MQVPPTCSRSISAVRLPARASAVDERAAGLPGADDDGVVVLKLIGHWSCH